MSFLNRTLDSLENWWYGARKYVLTYLKVLGTIVGIVGFFWAMTWLKDAWWPGAVALIILALSGFITAMIHFVRFD